MNGKGFELNIVQYIMRENVVKLLVSMKIILQKWKSTHKAINVTLIWGTIWVKTH